MLSATLPANRPLKATGQRSCSRQPAAMKRETRRYVKELAYFSSIGLSMALAIFIGLFVGIYLDRRLIFLIIGIVAGYRNIGLAIKKSRKL